MLLRTLIAGLIGLTLAGIADRAAMAQTSVPIGQIDSMVGWEPSQGRSDIDLYLAGVTATVPLNTGQPRRLYQLFDIPEGYQTGNCPINFELDFGKINPVSLRPDDDVGGARLEIYSADGLAVFPSELEGTQSFRAGALANIILFVEEEGEYLARLRLLGIDAGEGCTPDQGVRFVVFGGATAESYILFDETAATTQTGIRTLPTGWYWVPSRPGFGFGIERQPDDDMFIAIYLYNQFGDDNWLLATGTIGASGEQLGPVPLREFSGGATLLGPTQPASERPFGIAEGFVLVRGGSPTLISQIFTNQQVTERFVWRDPIDGQTVLPVPEGPENGWWWTEGEPGVGWFIETQRDELFAGGYFYSEAGDPEWALTIGPMANGQFYEGRLVQYADGFYATETQIFGGGTAEVANDLGPISFTFTSATEAIMTLPDGSQKTLIRFTEF